MGKTCTVIEGVAAVPEGATLMVGGSMSVGTPPRLIGRESLKAGTAGRASRAMRAWRMGSAEHDRHRGRAVHEGISRSWVKRLAPWQHRA